MDVNSYVLDVVIRHRLAEARARAAQRARLRDLPPRGEGRARVRIGLLLIALGTWVAGGVEPVPARGLTHG